MNKPSEKNCLTSNTALICSVQNTFSINFIFCFIKYVECKTTFAKHFFLFLFLLSSKVFSQFHGAVGSANTNAIHKDSSIFVAWAKTCVVNRGWQNIANTGLGYTNVGIDSNAIGKAGENPVVSLGDGGFAILTFDKPIINGAGYDFAVFENSFSNYFLELAFVEVSSDGVNYFRFPATSNTQHLTQIGPYDELGEPEKINNLAGKYRVFYGTPFDLEEMKNNNGLNVNAITHIKIIDVVGCIHAPYASIDVNSAPINDPYPTDFGNGGFDLDAVGVIHQLDVGINEFTANKSLNVFPNPANKIVLIQNPEKKLMNIQLINSAGNSVYTWLGDTNQFQLNVEEFPSGMYYILMFDHQNYYTQKLSIIH